MQKQTEENIWEFEKLSCTKLKAANCKLPQGGIILDVNSDRDYKAVMTMAAFMFNQRKLRKLDTMGLAVGRGS